MRTVQIGDTIWWNSIGGYRPKLRKFPWFSSCPFSSDWSVRSTRQSWTLRRKGSGQVIPSTISVVRMGFWVAVHDYTPLAARDGFTAVQIGRNGDARTRKRAVQTPESHLRRMRTLSRTPAPCSGSELLLVIVAGSDAPRNDNPGPTAGCHARAQNTVRHSLIIGPTITSLL